MGKRLDPKEAEAIMLGVGLKPLEPYLNNHHKWQTRCLKCGEVNEKTLKSVLKNKLGCVFCGGKRINPIKASERMLEKGFVTLEPFKRSAEPWKSNCVSCGNTVYPSYKYVITQDGKGCKHCSNTFVSPEDARKLMLQHGLEPLEPYRNSMTPWKCKCLKCGEISTPMYSVVNYRQGGCKYCSGNSITHENAVLVMQKAGYEPQEPYKDSKTKWKSIHIQCGSLVSPKLNTITTGTGGCRNCSTIGFEVNKSAFVYVMENSALNSIKVGIGNQDSKPNRIKVHEKHGWVSIEVFGFQNGWDALNIETAFFSWLRKKKGIKAHLTIGQTPQSGWSETMSASEITSQEVIAKLREIVEELSSA
jgi:hypothetical protein